MEPENYEIDTVDRGILAALLQDARIPFSDIAKKLEVSSGTIHVRVEKLKAAGIISGASLQIDYQKMGYDLSAFIGINLEHPRDYTRVLKELKECSAIVEAYYTTGKFNIFTKVIVRTIDHLYRFLTKELQLIPGVQSTETIMILDRPIKRDLKI